MAITPLPAVPLRSDAPATFVTKADAFLGALNLFATEVDAVGVALTLGATNSTSTTSLVIGLGSKSLTVQTGKSYVIGMTVKIASTATGVNWMLGDITSYTTGTGALVVTVAGISGSGTFADWSISQSATGGAKLGINSDITSLTALDTSVLNIGSGQVYKDASGKVGIGTSSPSTKLEVKSMSNAEAKISTDNNAYAYLTLNTWALDRAQLRGEAANPGAGSGTGSGTLSFWTANNSALAERMRIDGSGNVGIGTSSPSTKLEVKSMNNAEAKISTDNNAYAYLTLNTWALDRAQLRGEAANPGAGSGTGSGTLSFWTANNSALAERMRIDSSGNLMVGATTFPGSSSKMLVSGDLNATYTNGVIQGQSKTAGDVSYPALYLSKFDNNSTTSQVLVRFTIGNYAAGQGQINGNGANAAAFGSFSDRRLKENITDLPSQLNNILLLRPVEFDYIAGGHQIGFIAQEIHDVYPDVVGEDADGMLTVTGWSKTEARLVKAIQEQQTLIEALTARLTALEDK